jgi:D-glycero-alpha-D-manno-heptose-7-phosphate kinase
MHDHWVRKRERSEGMSNEDVDRWYEIATANGALGGKLVGAGGGGFLLFYAAEPKKLREAMANAGLIEVRFGFDFDGSTVVARD